MPILKALRPLFNFHREICIVTAELRINAVIVWHAPYMCLSCVHSSVYTCLNRHCQCQLYSCFLLSGSKNTYIKHLHFVGSGSLFLCTITLYYRANSHTLKTLLFTGLFILFLRKNFLRFLWACLGSFSAFFAFTPFFYFFPELERWILPQGMPLFQTTRMRGG